MARARVLGRHDRAEADPAVEDPPQLLLLDSPLGEPGEDGRPLPGLPVEARIDWNAWERPPVFVWLAEQGVEEEELRRVFNCGIGFCAVAPPGTDGNVIGVIA